MSILSFFKKVQKTTPQQETQKQNNPKFLVEVPQYNMNLEYLDMVKGKRIEHMFFGSTSLVPKEKRDDIISFFDKCLKDGWVYVTKGKESIANSFTKKDFTQILKDNNLSVSGNKIDLVERIDSNLGIDKLQKIGEIVNTIKLTDLGKSKIEEYKTEFNKQKDAFDQNIYNLFLLNEVEEACIHVSLFKESYPFNRSGFFMSYSNEELYNKCKKIRSSDIIKKIGVPEMYQGPILSIVCMYDSLGDFDYKKKIEETYTGFEDLLTRSDLVKNKDYPFMDFQNLIMGLKVEKHDLL